MFLRKKEIIIGLIFLIIFLIRYYFVLPNENILDNQYLGKEVVLQGKIVAEPDRRDQYTNYVVLGSDSKKEFSNEKILITSDRFPEYEYGDAVELRGKIDLPKEFETDLGRTFDHPNYLAKDGIRYVSFRPQINFLGKGRGSKILSSLYSIKQKFVTNIEIALPEPYSSLANGITLGMKQSLGKDLLEKFRIAGIIHIVVLSGYNMTIIFAGVLFALRRFRREVTLICAAVLTIIFAALVGFSATVMRATLMSLLAILARFLGRPVFALRTLFIAGALMLLYNPLILLYDPSFQLSFMATLGLIVVSPIVEVRLESIFPEMFKIYNDSSWWKNIFKEITTATIATQIFVLPLLIYMTGQFSIVSLPTNLLVLPLIPTAMAFTGLAGVIGFISATLSKIIVFPAFIILELIIKISSLASHIPLSFVTIQSFPLWLVFLVYTLYGWFLWRAKRSTNSLLP